MMGAYFRKYKDDVKQDLFHIHDKKKEYFYIDTSQYMNYTVEDLTDESHCHHGPQPEGESLDSSWLVEVDKFLKGEENHLKDHKRFYNYGFELKDKSFPSAEAAADLMHKTEWKLWIFGNKYSKWFLFKIIFEKALISYLKLL